MPKPAKVPEDLYCIMLECWAASPEERPTFKTLTWQLKHFVLEDHNYKRTVFRAHSIDFY